MEEKDLDKIERYFQNQLSTEEQSAFERRRSNDPQFAESVELFELSKAIIKNNHREKLIGDAQHYMDEWESEKKSSSFLSNPVLSLAAAFLVLIVAIFLFRQFSAPTDSPTNLFAQHFELPSTPSVRSTENNVNVLWNKAVTSYNNENYSEAIIPMQALTENETIDFKNRVYFYLGMSYLKENHIEDAVVQFRKVSTSSSYTQQAIWYEALAYLKGENIQKATVVLEKVAQSEGHYKQKTAQALLEQIGE